MHKSMIGGVAGLILLVTALLTWDANAITLTGVGTLSSQEGFACSYRGLLVRTVGGHNGSARRRSILPMLLSPREGA